jgi:hypothetical protein
MSYLTSPLEQFAIHLLAAQPLPAFLHLNNSVVFILLVWTLAAALWTLALHRAEVVPSR